MDIMMMNINTLIIITMNIVIMRATKNVTIIISDEHDHHH